MAELRGAVVSSGVLAIVLTFDAPVELTRCVTAIAAQEPKPDLLLVVDNDSRPPAGQLLDSLDLDLPVEVLRLATNTGPAGGHAAGLEYFAQSRFDVAWVMDDDCEPQTGALDRLLAAAEAAGPDVDPIYPTWINTALGRATDYPAWCGFLIRRSTVEAVGVPRAEFFWWMEDTEFLHWRVREAGFTPQRLEDAVVLHHQDRRRGPKPAWKFYYETRNAVYFRLWVQRGRGRRFYRMGRAVAGAVKGSIKGPDRGQKFALVVRGVMDGTRGSLGVRPGLPPARPAP